jgi:hypothetical protein
MCSKWKNSKHIKKENKNKKRRKERRERGLMKRKGEVWVGLVLWLFFCCFWLQKEEEGRWIRQAQTIFPVSWLPFFFCFFFCSHSLTPFVCGEDNVTGICDVWNPLNTCDRVELFGLQIESPGQCLRFPFLLKFCFLLSNPLSALLPTCFMAAVIGINGWINIRKYPNTLGTKKNDAEKKKTKKNKKRDKLFLLFRFFLHFAHRIFLVCLDLPYACHVRSLSILFIFFNLSHPFSFHSA